MCFLFLFYLSILFSPLIISLSFSHLFFYLLSLQRSLHPPSVVHSCLRAISQVATDILAIISQQTVAETQVMPFYRMTRQDENGTLGSHRLIHSGGLHQDSDDKMVDMITRSPRQEIAWAGKGVPMHHFKPGLLTHDLKSLWNSQVTTRDFFPCEIRRLYIPSSWLL